MQNTDKKIDNLILRIFCYVALFVAGLNGLKCRTEDGVSDTELKRVTRSCMRKIGENAAFSGQQGHANNYNNHNNNNNNNGNNHLRHGSQGNQGQQQQRQQFAPYRNNNRNTNNQNYNDYYSDDSKENNNNNINNNNKNNNGENDYDRFGYNINYNRYSGLSGSRITGGIMDMVDGQSAGNRFSDRNYSNSHNNNNSIWRNGGKAIGTNGNGNGNGNGNSSNGNNGNNGRVVNSNRSNISNHNANSNNYGRADNRENRNNSNYNSNKGNNNDNNNDTNYMDTSCIVHCFFEEMNMLNKDNYPDRRKVEYVLTKDMRDRELRNFYSETIEQCFRNLESQRRTDKCHYSQELISCMSEYAKANCDDWQEHNMLFN